jgi:hypothetical protein
MIRRRLKRRSQPRREIGSTASTSRSIAVTAARGAGQFLPLKACYERFLNGRGDC